VGHAFRRTLHVHIASGSAELAHNDAGAPKLGDKLEGLENAQL
jgi:hypothetical protein